MGHAEVMGVARAHSTVAGGASSASPRRSARGRQVLEQPHRGDRRAARLLNQRDFSGSTSWRTADWSAQQCPGSRLDGCPVSVGCRARGSAASTLTRGSPRKPELAASVCCATSSRTRAGVAGRAPCATRATWYSARGRADVRIEAAAPRRSRGRPGRRVVVRDRRPCSASMRASTASVSAGLRRPQVRAARRGRVVRIRRGGRGAAPEVLRVVEGLADERRAHRLAVLHDQAAVGLAREQRPARCR